MPEGWKDKRLSPCFAPCYMLDLYFNPEKGYGSYLFLLKRICAWFNGRLAKQVNNTEPESKPLWQVNSDKIWWVAHIALPMLNDRFQAVVVLRRSIAKAFLPYISYGSHFVLHFCDPFLADFSGPSPPLLAPPLCAVLPCEDASLKMGESIPPKCTCLLFF